MELKQIAIEYYKTSSQLKARWAEYKELLHTVLPGKRELTTIAEIIDEIAHESKHGISPFQWNDGESWLDFIVKNLEDAATSETPEAQELFQQFIIAARAYGDLRKRRGILRRKLYWAGKRLDKEEK